MPDHGARTAIIVALIGVIGTISASVIANWDKFSNSGQQASPKTKPVAINNPQSTTNTGKKTEPEKNNELPETKLFNETKPTQKKRYNYPSEPTITPSVNNKKLTITDTRKEVKKRKYNINEALDPELEPSR